MLQSEVILIVSILYRYFIDHNTQTTTWSDPRDQNRHQQHQQQHQHQHQHQPHAQWQWQLEQQQQQQPAQQQLFQPAVTSVLRSAAKFIFSYGAGCRKKCYILGL